MTEQQFLERYCSGLNEEQLKAVRAVDGAVLLLAVPGSGKTTVLVTRLGYMVCCRGIAPENILTMTYTVAATREMSARFSRLFGSGYGDAMEIRTINGLSQKIIDYYSETEGRSAFTLQDDEGALSGLVRELYREYYDDYPSESVIRDIRTAITYCKNSMFTQSEIEDYDIGLKYFPQIYTRYCEALKRERRMDYDDQLLYALNILKNRPAILNAYQDRYSYICVDESQDTSRLQHEIIHLLAKKHGNLFMVGDEDQSIYGFRAAYPDALNSFESDYPGASVLVMEQNYRSTEEIIQAANGFVSKNRFRHPKTTRPTQGSGIPVQFVAAANRSAQYHYLFEYAKTCSTETAILSRNNDSAVPLIDLFERSGIPYNCRQFDDVFFSHRILRDLEDIILFAEDDCNQERFLRIYHKLGCMISKTAAQYACQSSAKTGKSILLELIRCPELSQYSMHSITELYEAMKALPEDNALDALNRIRYSIGYGEYVERNKLDAGKFTILAMLARHVTSARGLLERLEELRICIQNHVYMPEASITLSTIHSSKGLEYDRVFLLDVLDGILPAKTGENAHSQEEIRQYEEERRLFYVGMTRAKRELFLFHCRDQLSEFVREIKRNVPRESFSENEYLSSLPADAIGKLYWHNTLGKGRIIAQHEQSLLTEYSGCQIRLHTIDEMIADRQRRMETPKILPEKKETLLPQNMTQGGRVVHVSFGKGTIRAMDMETISVCFDSDGRERTFLKSAVLPTGKLKTIT